MSFNPRKVVVPIDFSPSSGKAIQAAMEIAGDRSAIHLVHVLYPLDAVSPGVVWGDIDDTKREKAVRKSFDRFIKDYDCGGVNVEVRFGHPGEEITRYADEIAADLIVVPSHGYHGMKRFVLGSIAEKVIRHANCSVLVLRRSDAD